LHLHHARAYLHPVHRRGRRPRGHHPLFERVAHVGPGLGLAIDYLVGEQLDCGARGIVLLGDVELEVEAVDIGVGGIAATEPHVQHRIGKSVDGLPRSWLGIVEDALGIGISAMSWIATWIVREPWL